METEPSMELITIKQLPIIEERLIQMEAQITAQVEAALAMPCTEDTVKEIKKVRAGLNNGFKDLEARRILVKKAILAPYDQFEESYKKHATNIINAAVATLTERINAVEDKIKADRRAEVVEHYNLVRAGKGLDFPAFDAAGITVGLSGSVESLKSQADTFLERIARDVAYIGTLPFAEEVMVEYRVSLDLSRAATTVTMRHKAIEDERAHREAAGQVSVPAPVHVEPPPEKIAHIIVNAGDEYTVTFKITGNQRQFEALKEFLDGHWYTYEEEK